MTASSPRSRRAVVRVAGGLTALTVVVALLFAACGSDGSGSSDTSGDTTTTVVNTTSIDAVTVEGDVGSKPTVTFDPSFQGSESTSKVITIGDGPAVQAGQRVTVDYLAVSGADGTELGGTYGSDPETIIMGSQDLLPIISTALEGQPVGSRVLIAADTTGTTGEWLLLVFDIKSAETIPTSASGETVTPDPGLPAVTVENGVPTIAAPQGDPPTDMVVQPLIKGTGPEITAGQTVTFQFVGMVWASGTVFGSSWATGAQEAVVGAGQLIPGFDEGLVGQTVGSRVMLVLPPDKGYGADGNSSAGIGPNDTLVFVIDLLAAS
jgi:peptidylprolyl isomerase